MNHSNGGAAASGANAREVSDKLLALTTEALAFISRERAEGMARQWLAGVPLSNGSEQSVLARSLALELALSVPSSLTGTTAFDRLARAMKGRPPEDAAAVTLLRRSRLRLARLSRERFEDLATGEILPLLSTPPSDAVGNNTAFGRFTTTEEGYILATGTLVLLDDDALAVARGFVRPGGRGSAIRSAAPRPSTGTSSATARRRRIGAVRLAEGNPSCRSSRIAIRSMLWQLPGRR